MPCARASQMANAEPTELFVRRRRAAGRLRNAWSRNRIALGAAAVSTESFDVSEFHAVQSAVLRLARMLPATTSAPETAAAYNREAALDDETLRDQALIDRRVVCAARGTDFIAPEALQRRIDLFASGGRFVGDVDPQFDKGDWANAFSSVGILPATYDPLLEAMPQAELDDHFARMRQAMEQAIGGMPTHADLLSHLGATA